MKTKKTGGRKKAQKAQISEFTFAIRAGARDRTSKGRLVITLAGIVSEQDATAIASQLWKGPMTLLKSRTKVGAL